jgi:hypothetical protein
MRSRRDGLTGADPNRIKGSPWIMTVLATRAERPVNAGDNSRSSFFAE